jgi:hypothetical protein
VTGTSTIRIGGWFQGPTGSGQGGWTAQRFVSAIGDGANGPLTTAIRAAIPLDVDLTLVANHDHWDLVAPDGTLVMTATTWDAAFADTAPVTIDEARAARLGFGDLVVEHPVPSCFSCGTMPESMGVHAGPLSDGTDRFATDWTVPDWAVGDDGTVDAGALWAAIDCCVAWWVGWSRERRTALTVQYAVDEIRPLVPGATYALVGWSGDHHPEWDGRKRHGASAAFDVDGRCVARSVSFWVGI